MSLDHLRETWRREALSPPGRKAAEELAAVTERAAELDRAVRWRDRIETTVALVLLPVFAWVAWATPHPVSAVGSVILALACAAIPVRLRMARRRHPDPGLPLAQSLRAELGRIRAQDRLLGSVAWPARRRHRRAGPLDRLPPVALPHPRPRHARAARAA